MRSCDSEEVDSAIRPRGAACAAAAANEGDASAARVLTRYHIFSALERCAGVVGRAASRFKRRLALCFRIIWAHVRRAP